MKPEFKIEGREASPAEYAQLMEALLASQAATPTARACAAPESLATPSFFDLLADAAPSADEPKEGEEPLYPGVSAFLETGRSTSSPVSGAPRDRARPA